MSVPSLLYYLFRNVSEYWILILLMQYVCSARMNLCRKHIIICSLLSTICHALAFLTSSFYLQLFSMIILIGVTVILFSSRRIKDLLLFFPAFAIYLLLTLMPETILSELHPAFGGSIQIMDFSFEYMSVATDMILLIVLIVLRKILIKYESIIPFRGKELVGCIGLLCFSFVDIGLLMTLSYMNMEPIHYYLWAFIFAGAFLLCLAYYLYNLIDTRIQFYRQTLTKNDTEYLKLQLENLQNSKENEEHTKRMRHDLKNHISIINSLCEDGKYDELREYTNQLNKEANSSGDFIFSGNEIADIVLRSKRKQATENGISFEFQGTLEALNNLDSPDICGLLANAYDNAIEACQSIEEAYIRTTVSNTNNYTVIQICNPISGKVPIHNNHIRTTKKEKHAHGYGLEIMKRIVRKYGGKLALDCTDTEFQIKITLLISKTPVIS